MYVLAFGVGVGPYYRQITITNMASLLLGSAFAAVVAAALYKVGLFDRPPFEEKVLEPEFYLFMACVRTKDIGGNVVRLLKGSRSAVEILGNDKLTIPATKYGAPEGADGLSFGIYLDNPKTAASPRWGIGWAVEVDSDDDLKAMLQKVNEASTLDEPIRVVKIGGGAKTLSGRIPWRFSLTPAIAPMLHWSRAFSAYEKGGYKAKVSQASGDNSDACWTDSVEAIACEAYVTGKNHSMEYIDYIVYLENPKEIINDMFPVDASN